MYLLILILVLFHSLMSQNLLYFRLYNLLMPLLHHFLTMLIPEGDAPIIISLISLIPFILLLKLLFRRLQLGIDRKAMEEAAEVTRMSPKEHREYEVQSKLKYSRPFAVFMIIFAFVVAAALISFLPFAPDTLEQIGYDTLKSDKTYLAENLIILDSYASAEDGQTYYIAMFYDADEVPSLISFTPGRDNALSSRLTEYLNNPEAVPGDEVFSGYLSITASDDVPYNLRSYYSSDSKELQQYLGCTDTERFAVYVCDAHENPLVHSITPVVVFGLCFSLLCLGCGIYMFSESYKAELKKNTMQ